ncbi:pro-neuregulin-1, membrane-bound isoform isoform X2 [Echeneis naucrates]|uniref:pro-neuregulin-1, membrane-bound isoform isoform X2 n=1 Tax=Echeneis naucrates TaxID=173247 RepID=UPI00111460AE|nr:pro-neuregulin-1, membrane-bound isoform-like isoform X2 [Echeneis naucrates]
MTEGMEDFSAGPVPPAESTSPTGSTVDTGQVPEEKPEELEAAGESGEECGEGTGEGGADGDGEHLGALGIMALPGTCCVCIEVEQINNCLHSEKICILPILACLLSLALCTAGLKWVFVDKIFEYEPPTHLDPKRIGQTPVIISIAPTLGLTVSIPHSSTVSITTGIAITPGYTEGVEKEESTQGPHVPQVPPVTQSDHSVTLKYNAERPTISRETPHPQATEDFNIIIPTVSTTSTTTTAKTSSHVTHCIDSQKNYCVNGGECFTLEIMPGSTKFLCRCLAGFTGHRCEQAVLKKVSDPKQAEELYQKRILTISGICIALLVVGIMCVVAYCKTKKQRKKLHDRLRQSLRNKRNHNTNTGFGPNLANSARGRQISNLPLQDLQLISCTGMTPQHGAEKETETTFSTSKYEHEVTTLTHISSQRFASAMTSPTQLSPVSHTSPATPRFPPSEMSPPLSSLGISVPSVALSPSGEEECPLLLSKSLQQHKSSNWNTEKRRSAHYNYGHAADSLPPSPMFSMEDITNDHDNTDPSCKPSASPEQVLHTNNNISDCSTQTAAITNGQLLHDMETDSTVALEFKSLNHSRTNAAAPYHHMQIQCSSSAKLHPVAV